MKGLTDRDDEAKSRFSQFFESAYILSIPSLICQINFRRYPKMRFKVFSCVNSNIWCKILSNYAVMLPVAVAVRSKA
jgi:hypothetical protein